jgi:hypothetical protein
MTEEVRGGRYARQIILAEDDNLGHLWLYFPSIRNVPT